MQLDFFPSRILALYMMRIFASRIVAVLMVLVVILMMLDLLGKSGDILAYPGNGDAELWTYIGLRLPQLISRFLPYSVLLATLISLVSLNQNSEVIAMKAAGLSAHQILAPLLLTAGVVSFFNLVFNETMVAQATATLKGWEKNKYGPMPTASDARRNVYFADGMNILLASQVAGEGENAKMTGVTWYRRDPNGMLAQRVNAPEARYNGAGWVLRDAQVFDVATVSSTNVPAIEVGKTISPKNITKPRLDPDGLSFVALYNGIAGYEREGRPTSELWAKLWHKISGPFSTLLMPLLGSVAAFGLARSGHLFARAVIGMALGFTYFVVDTAALAVGNFGGYPPFLAAWGAFILFLLIGETVLIRTEE